MAKNLGFWVTCGVKMMSLHYGWGWQPPQTAFCIHLRHWQCAWAFWYAVHRHMVAALHRYTHPTWLRFWGSGSLVESKWCTDVKVDADTHLKLLPASILDISKCLSTLICCPLAYSSSLKLYPHSMVASTTLFALLPLSRWRWLLSIWHCQLHWHHQPLCAGIIALIVLALPPLLCWCCCPCCAGVAVCQTSC